MNTGRTAAATAKLPGGASDRWQWPRTPTAVSLSAKLESDDRRRVPPDGTEPVEPVDEQAVLPLIRKHWIFLAKGLGGPVVVGMFMFVLLVAHAGAFLPAAIVLLIAGAVAAWVLLYWMVTTVTVTDERVIITEGVLVRNILVIPLNRVQDVRSRQNLLGLVLGYGSVEIVTAGRIENELVTDLPDPRRLREQVFALLDRFQHGPETGV